MTGAQLLQEKDVDQLKKELRGRICDLIEDVNGPFFGIGSVTVSEALVESAFAWRDWNGGKADTQHAAKCLHEIVDRIEERLIG